MPPISKSKETVQFRIDRTDSSAAVDPEIGDLLTRVYVEEGYTTRERSATLFAPRAVCSRGQVICARAQAGGALAGIVIVVRPDAPARRMARADETEMHLLAVDPAYRGLGLGRTLVGAAAEYAHELGFRKIVLWTQPSMTAARKLYESAGFARAARRDPVFDGVQFLAYEIQW